VLSYGILGLVAANLLLLFLLLGAPLGVRTVSASRLIRAAPEKIHSGLHPLGGSVGWSGAILSSRPDPLRPDEVTITLAHEGRDGQPMERRLRLDDDAAGQSFRLRIVDDSALDPRFWRDYEEAVTIEPASGGARVTIRRRDRYRGAAFLIFRHFALRREMSRLRMWAETGQVRSGGVFEHPATQVGFAIVSALLLWPLFGLTVGGLILASVLTVVVALHELGHMAAFRLMGHRRTRMIFVPLLGGIAIGGRPYDSRFEVAFVALMGAGFSAFLVPIAIVGSGMLREAGEPFLAALAGTFAGLLALFNLANLVPVWKFDGGQVLRQVFGSPATQAAASCLMASAFLLLGSRLGVPTSMLFFCGGVFVLLSLATAGTGVAPRHALKPLQGGERAAMGAALVAVFLIHAHGTQWAVERMMERSVHTKMRAADAAQSPSASPSRL
jgi:Zn-dependent protease